MYMQYAFEAMSTRGQKYGGSTKIDIDITDAQKAFLQTRDPLADRIRFLAICAVNWPWLDNDVPWLLVTTEIRKVPGGKS